MLEFFLTAIYQEYFEQFCIIISITVSKLL